MVELSSRVDLLVADMVICLFECYRESEIEREVEEKSKEQSDVAERGRAI